VSSNIRIPISPSDQTRVLVKPLDPEEGARDKLRNDRDRPLSRRAHGERVNISLTCRVKKSR
jgi:hypothetical protein